MKQHLIYNVESDTFELQNTTEEKLNRMNLGPVNEIVQQWQKLKTTNEQLEFQLRQSIL
tara:strand:+ start:23798 stop:23974 length:177 start_codon:yes stop_codon:yes gene_type:complete